MLINWQHEDKAESKDDSSTFYGINYDSVVSLRNLDILEKNIVQKKKMLCGRKSIQILELMSQICTHMQSTL